MAAGTQVHDRVRASVAAAWPRPGLLGRTRCASGRRQGRPPQPVERDRAEDAGRREVCREHRHREDEARLRSEQHRRPSRQQAGDGAADPGQLGRDQRRQATATAVPTRASAVTHSAARSGASIRKTDSRTSTVTPSRGARPVRTSKAPRPTSSPSYSCSTSMRVSRPPSWPACRWSASLSSQSSRGASRTH